MSFSNQLLTAMAEKLNELSITSNPYYWRMPSAFHTVRSAAYNRHDPASMVEGQRTHDGVLYAAMPKAYTYYDDHTPRSFVEKAMSMAAIMRDVENHEGTARTDVPLSNVAQLVLHDATDSIMRRRLTQRQKDAILEVIYGVIERSGRNPHERATMIMEVFQGQRKSHNTIYQKGPEPYAPALGTLGKTLSRLQTLESMVRFIPGAPALSKTFAFDTLEDAGANVRDVMLAELISVHVAYESSLQGVQEFYDKLSPAFKEFEHERPDEGWRIDVHGSNTRESYIVRHHINSHMHLCKLCESLHKFSGQQSDCATDAELCDFVDELIKKLINKAKRRAS